MKRWLIPLIAVLAVSACAGNAKERKQEVDQNQRAAIVHVQLGSGYMRQGKNELALAKLKRALELNPNLPSAHYVIAVLYGRLGENDLADTHYRRAVTLAPEDPEAHNNYGIFLCGQNRLKEADEQFLAALKNPLYRTPQFAYTNAGVCALRVPDEAKAEQYFLQAIRLNPQFSSALYELAQLNFNKQRLLPARAYLQRYLEAADYNAAVLWLGIRIERGLGDTATAANYAKLLTTNFPDSKEASMLLDAEQHGQPAGQ